MVSNSVKKILQEFDNVLNDLKKNKEVNVYLNKMSLDIKLLELWREEITSNKQSIYIIGKTSTGKSEFHNFLLDVKNKKDYLFKTSTKVETGIIQTLEHCKNQSDSYANIHIKNKNEFNKLLIPKETNAELNNKFLKIPLNNSENIIFFRENIIAKSDAPNSFDLISAVSQVDIVFPLKYLQKYRIIDTPGLASSQPKTDSIVRKYFQGKSHVFWFLDASKRTISDSLTLLKTEKQLIKNSFKRILFFTNKFDLMEYDDVGGKTKIEVENRKNELSKSIKTTLQNILTISNLNFNIYFTSFKKPEKKFLDENTIDIINKIDKKFISEKKKINYDNINSLISSMKKVLTKIKNGIISKKEEKIDKDIQRHLNKKRELLIEQTIAQKIKKETIDTIDKVIINIKSIKKESNLNTHDRYNKYVDNFKTEIEKSCTTIKNSFKRIPEISIKQFDKKILQIKKLDGISLKEKETIWKKYFNDNELDKMKDILSKLVSNKIDTIDSLKIIINKELDLYNTDEVKKERKTILNLEKQKIEIQQNSKIITNIRNKIDHINKYLLEDIEKKVAKWNPHNNNNNNNNNNNIWNFLSLYALLEEHEMIKHQIIKNGK